MKTFTLTVLTALSAVLPPATAQEAAPRKKAIHDLLTEQTFKTFRDSLASTPDDWMWLSIPWQPDLGTGISMANEQDKPVALWIECGHPLAEV